MSLVNNYVRRYLRKGMGDGHAADQLAQVIDVAGGIFGNVFYVNSSKSSASDTGGGLNPDTPLATLDAAIALCTANNGDVVFVMPGHSETLSADSAVDIDVAGITIIGLGSGTNRPTFTFDTAVTADFKLAAANTTIVNLLFKAGIDALTGPIEVSAANCSIINCEYQDDDSNNYETTDVITTTTAAHYLLIDGFVFLHDGGSGGTQQQSVINLVSADFAEIRNCRIVCDGAAGCIEDATASAQIYIHDNHLESSHANDICITLASTTTGEVSDNRLKIATDGQTTWISADNDCGLYENYGVNADAQTGGLIGTVST